MRSRTVGCEPPAREIDAVYTWVDGSDPVWQARKHASLQRAGLTVSSPSNRAQRFANHDELRYSLRALAQNLPWIRTIHVLTDGQCPAWLDTKHPRIRLTDHREFFRDRDHLPCFNSLAIEANLGRVPGLAEHFIYFNDDMLINRPMAPSDFFGVDGKPRLFVFPKTRFALERAAGTLAGSLVRAAQRSAVRLWLHYKARRRTPFSAALRYTQLMMLDRQDGPLRRFKTHHTPMALTRRFIQEIESAYPREFEATSSHPFRSATDLYFPDLYATHGIGAGLAVPHACRRTDLFYFHLGRDPESHLHGLRHGSHSFVNIDDAGSHGEQDERALAATLQRLFPAPAPFEITDTASRSVSAPEFPPGSNPQQVA